jgi:tetratricopeptide (TPR) repeat protein
MKAVWPDSFVEEVNIPRAVHHLRKTLGHDNNGSKFIETVPTKGYRFVAKVSCASAASFSDPMLESDVAISGSPWTSRLRRGALLYSTAGLIVIWALASGWYAGIFGSSDTVTHSRGEHSQNGQAYNHYRQGRLLIDRKLPNDRDAALAEFEKAIELDPEYSAAYAGKADVKFTKFWASGTHDDVVQSRAAALKAIQLDPYSSYAYTILCRIKFTYDWDFAAAEKDCRKAIELDPSSADAHHEFAMGLISIGRKAQAVSEIEKAISLSPTSFYKRNKGLILYFSREFDAAIEQIERVRSTDPEFRDAIHWLMRAYEAKRDYDNAFRVYLDMDRARKGPERSDQLKYVYKVQGWPGILRDLIETWPGTNSSPPQMAATYCQLGNKEKAFENLAKGFEQRSLWMAHILMEPRFDPCREDPRFAQFLEKVYRN